MTKENAVPKMCDYEWHNYVMGLFGEDELEDGNPNLDGLLRVARYLLGKVTVNNLQIHQCPTPENGNRATVSLQVFTTDNNSNVLCMYDAADSFSGNTDAPFYKHPVATAISRAKSRALRSLLGLRKTLSAEEVSENSKDSTEQSNVDRISAQQITMLDKISKKLNINLSRFINSTNDVHYDNIRDISYVAAQDMFKRINKYQQDETIPPELLGYKEDWRNNLQ